MAEITSEVNLQLIKTSTDPHGREFAVPETFKEKNKRFEEMMLALKAEILDEASGGDKPTSVGGD
jgi:hypothetical protein